MNDYKVLADYYGRKVVTANTVKALNDLAETLLDDLSKDRYSRRKTITGVSEMMTCIEQLLVSYGISGKEIKNQEHVLKHKAVKRMKKDKK